MRQAALKKNKLRGRSIDIHTGNTVQHFHRSNCGAEETGVSSSVKDFTSLKATTESPSCSFEFYVWSDGGINLHVDLNSSPSDWANRFRNEVCASENVYGKESTSLLQDLGYMGESSTQGKHSLLWNKNSIQIDDRNGQIKSSSCLKSAKDDVTGLDPKNKGSSPSICDSLTPCDMTSDVAKNLNENQPTVTAELTVNVADNLKEYESTFSAQVCHGEPNNYISGAESCAKDASKKILISDATDNPFMNSICGSVGNSLSDSDTLERQISTSKNEISEDCTMLNGSCSVNRGMGCPGASLSGYLELQASEVASCHKNLSPSLCENDGFLDLNDPKNTLNAKLGGLGNSSDIELNTDGKNLPSLTDEWEAGKAVIGRESSECSQFGGPLKESGLECGDQESKMKLCKKRKHVDSEIQGSSDKPATATVLRSMKNIQPRRSMRLISK